MCHSICLQAGTRSSSCRLQVRLIGAIYLFWSSSGTDECLRVITVLITVLVIRSISLELGLGAIESQRLYIELSVTQRCFFSCVCACHGMRICQTNITIPCNMEETHVYRKTSSYSLFVKLIKLQTTHENAYKHI